MDRAPARRGRPARPRPAARRRHRESLLPAPWNVRSRVVEYGGQPWAAVARPTGGPLVVFCHFTDQRLYAHEPDAAPGTPPRPLTPVSAVGGGLRWVDPVIHPDRGEVWCVLEEFTGPAPTDVRRVLAAVPLDGSAADDRAAVRELSDGRHRFVTGPRLSPDGRRAAWIAWDHPRMPWDGTEVQLAEVTPYGTFREARTVAGGPAESIPQVDWDAAGRLLLVSDRTGWWNLYRAEVGTDGALAGPEALCPRAEEFGGPLWKIGLRWFAPLENGLIAVVHGRGTTTLGILDPERRALVDAGGNRTEWASTLAAHGTRVVGVAASPHRSYELVELDTRTGRSRVVGAAHTDAVDPAYLPEPRIRTFTGPGGREIHAQVYPPHHPGHSGPEGELPPYVIWAHGGPTATPRSSSTWRSPTSPRAASASPRSTTAARPATAGSTGSGCASSGASSTSRTARPSRPRSWPRAPPTRPGSPCAAAARAAGRPPRPSSPPTCTPVARSSTPSWTCGAGPPTRPTTSSQYLHGRCPGQLRDGLVEVWPPPAGRPGRRPWPRPSSSAFDWSAGGAWRARPRVRRLRGEPECRGSPSART
ncbi:hypothetical protein STANM309S_04254 [Streptomyces tanashiensis]